VTVVTDIYRQGFLSKPTAGYPSLSSPSEHTVSWA
jgi:hypothetical protein